MSEPTVTFADDGPLPPELPPTAAGLPVAGGKPAAPSYDSSEYDHGPLQLSDLAALREEVTDEITRPPLRLRVPERKGDWMLELVVDIDGTVFSRFQKMADRKGKKRARGEAIDLADVSEEKLSALLLGYYCSAIYRGGRKLVDDEGDPITFKSREWHELVGVNPGDPTPAATSAEKMYGGSDGLLVQAGRALMRESGWLDVAAAVDDDEDELLGGEVGPTRPS